MKPVVISNNTTQAVIFASMMVFGIGVFLCPKTAWLLMVQCPTRADKADPKQGNLRQSREAKLRTRKVLHTKSTVPPGKMHTEPVPHPVR